MAVRVLVTGTQYVPWCFGRCWAAAWLAGTHHDGVEDGVLQLQLLRGGGAADSWRHRLLLLWLPHAGHIYVRVGRVRGQCLWRLHASVACETCQLRLLPRPRATFDAPVPVPSRSLARLSSRCSACLSLCKCPSHLLMCQCATTCATTSSHHICWV